jgi:hypothetical protein
MFRCPRNRVNFTMADKHRPTVLLAVLGLTVFCGVFAVAILMFAPNPTPPLMERAFNALFQMFEVGAGAIFGLLGGRARA